MTSTRSYSSLLCTAALTLMINCSGAANNTTASAGAESDTSRAGAGATGAQAGDNGSRAGQSGAAQGGTAQGGTAQGGSGNAQGGNAQGGNAQGGTAQGGTGTAQGGSASISGGGGVAGTSAMAGGSGQTQSPGCVKPIGVDVPAQDYTLPAGCTPNIGFHSMTSGVTVTTETAFRLALNCPDSTSSGIDFSQQCLRITPTWPTRLTRKWAVENSNKCVGCPASAGQIHIGFDEPAFCGGAVPQDVLTLTLLPASGDSIIEDFCTPPCKQFYP